MITLSHLTLYCCIWHAREPKHTQEQSIYEQLRMPNTTNTNIFQFSNILDSHWDALIHNLLQLRSLHLSKVFNSRSSVHDKILLSLVNHNPHIRLRDKLHKIFFLHQTANYLFHPIWVFQNCKSKCVHISKVYLYFKD